MHIAQMLDTLNWGGAQKMQHFLVETLHPLGIDITVISLRSSSNSTIEADLKALGANVVSFPFLKLLSFRSFSELLGFMRKERFDLLHSYLTYSNIIGSIAGSLSNTPVIASLRSADFEFRGYSVQRELLERLVLRYLSKRVMANGNMVGQFARKRLGRATTIDVIPNAVEAFSPISDSDRWALRTQLVGDPNRSIILSVGRLAPLKGYPDLFNAFTAVHEEYPSAVLVIAGGGKIQDQLQEQVNSLGLRDHVVLLGVRNDARQIMAVADLYVNSSHWEGTPVSVLEAMATGLPIVATNVGENPYLLADGAGIIVPAKQPAELAAALKILLGSPVQRDALSKAALDRVSRHYSREVWRKSILELYAQVTPAAEPYIRELSGSL